MKSIDRRLAALEVQNGDPQVAQACAYWVDDTITGENVVYFTGEQLTPEAFNALYQSDVSLKCTAGRCSSTRRSYESL
jgi:hypothetical protein